MTQLLKLIAVFLIVQSTSLHAASGTIRSTPSSSSLGLEIEGDAARDIFDQIKKEPGGSYSFAREVKDFEGRNILCFFDGKTVAEAYCTGTLLAAPLEGDEAIQLFDKLVAYGEMYRFGEIESIWRRNSFRCERRWIRSAPRSEARFSTYKCETSVEPNGIIHAKMPAMVGVLN